MNVGTYLECYFTTHCPSFWFSCREFICRNASFSFSIHLDLSFHLRAGAGRGHGTTEQALCLNLSFFVSSSENSGKNPSKIQNANFFSGEAQKYGFYHTVNRIVRGLRFCLTVALNIPQSNPSTASFFKIL